MSESYETLRSLTDSGQVEIIHLVAPPRSSSTALERALLGSPDVDLQINDPWSIYNAEREGQTYDYILDRVAAAERPEGRPLSVVIKDIADYIPPGDTWTRLTELAKHTLFLVREPLLGAESLIRMMTKEIPVEEGETYARAAGYPSWEQMLAQTAAQRDYRPLEAIYQKLCREEQPIHGLPEMQVPVLTATPLAMIHRLGYENHDAYAQAKGAASWGELQEALVQGTSKPEQLTDLIDANFTSRITGWTALRQHLDHMPATASHDMIDATMYRAMPHAVLPTAFGRAGLRFGDEAVAWGPDGKPFDPDYDGEVPYYQKVIESTGVLPPIETPVPLERLPRFIADSITEPGGAFDTYRHFLGQIIERMPEERRHELATVAIDGKPLREIDPVFYAFYIGATNNDPITRGRMLSALVSLHPEHTSAIKAIESLYRKDQA